MAIGYLDDSKLTAIANSIRTKAGTSGTMTVDEMPTNIAAIPSSSPVTEKDVNFYDWDGTLLYSYTLAEARALQALPELPDDYGNYTASSWTESLSFINNLTYPWMVGVNYTTERTATKVYITVPEPDTSIGEDLTVYITAWMNTFVVDWGDGDSSTITYQTIGSHTYAAPGDYVLSIDRYPGNTWLYFNSYNQANPMFMSSRHYLFWTNNTYSDRYYSDSLVRQVEFGAGTRIYFSPFDYQTSLEKILIPSGTEIMDQQPFSFTGIKALSLPSDRPAAIPRLLSYCNTLELALVPSSWFSISSTQMYNFTYYFDYALRKINWPRTLLGGSPGTGVGNCLSYCHNLETPIGIPSGINLTGPSFWNQGEPSSNYQYALNQTVLLPFPSDLNNIGNEAFFSWRGKTSVIEIPALVNYIGTRAFRNSTIRTFIFKGTEPPELGNQHSLGYPGATQIYVPYGYKATYVAAGTYWSNYANYIHELPQA